MRLRTPPDSRLPSGALAAAGAGLLALLLVLWAGRGGTFLGHEWGLVVDRGGGAHSFLEPFHRHFVPLLVAVYKSLLATAGLGHYWAYRLLAGLAHLACVAVVFTYARDRLGWRLAAVVTAPLLAFGAASEVLLSPANLGIQASVVAGAASLLALERKDRRGDIAACGLLLLSLLAWDLGACFVLGATVELTLQRDHRRLWIPLGPIAVYALWYLVYAADDGVGPYRPLAGLGFAFRMAANALDSLLALPLGGATRGHGYHTALEVLGYLLLAGAIVLVARRVRRLGRLTPRVAALLAMLVSLWLFTGAVNGSGGDPFAGRYAYPGAVLVLLTLAELARGARLPRPAALSWMVGLSALLMLANGAWLIADGADRRGDAEVLRAELSATELAGPNAPSGRRVDQRRAPGVTARDYLAARADHGSAALPAGDLAGASEGARRAADRLLRATLVTVGPADKRTADTRPGARVTVAGTAAPFVREKQRCVAINTPPGHFVDATFALPRTGVVLIARGRPGDRRGVTVRVRRFAPAYSGSVAVLNRSGEATLVAARPDRSPRPWQATVRAMRRVSVC